MGPASSEPAGTGDRGRPTLQLPAGLAQAWHVATHGGFAQLVAAQAELLIDSTRTTSQRATRTLARRAGVARQALQLALGFHLLLVGGFRAEDDLLQLGTPCGVLFNQFGPLEVAVKGADKQVVGQVAAKIRGFRPPEPYKGKGVRYAGEYINRKEAKKA